MKKYKTNVIDISSETDKIERGEGFYSVCKTEHEKDMRPARKNLNILKEALFLISSSSAHLNNKSNCFYKLSSLLERVLKSYGTDKWDSFLRKFKVKIMRICEDIKREKRDEFDKMFNDMNINNDSDDSNNFKLDDNQKNIIYNMLLANGVSDEEAINELLKY
ncbi:MAG: hypothetical protein J6L02_04830 [Bacteroidales bacterium]|nr:hypothetical protein [Bacteroidales bacterium]